VSTLANPYQSLKSAVNIFIAAPLHFLILQSPLILDSVVEAFYPSLYQSITWQTSLVLIFLSMGAGFLSAATIISLKRRLGGERPSVVSVYRETLTLWRQLIPATALFYALFLLGAQAFILLGIFFGAVFMYVPFLIGYQPGSPVFGYFNWSRRIAAKRIGSTLLFICLVFGTSIYAEISVSWWSELFQLAGVPLDHAVRLGVIPRTATVLVLNALMDLWIAVYLVNLLKGEPI